MRGKLHLGLVVGIVLSFLQAPFLHIHDGDGEHQHAHGFAHSHWLAEGGSGSSITSSDETGEARQLLWMPGDGNPPSRLNAVLPGEVMVPKPTVALAIETELIPRSHDPPWRLALKARAPPA